MNSTPILPIYVQLWVMITLHQLEIFPLNQSTTFAELHLLYSHLPLIESSYPIVSSITSKWEKPVALIKSLAKNFKCWMMYSSITSLMLQRRALMIELKRRALMIALFPSQWKTAQVDYIHKKGSTQDCGNYRPISLLNIPSKLLESIACF